MDGDGLMDGVTEVLSLEGALHGGIDWKGGKNCDCLEGCNKTWQTMIAADFEQHSLILQDCYSKDVRATNFKWTMLSKDKTISKKAQNKFLKEHGYKLELKSSKQWGRWFSGDGIPFWKCPWLEPRKSKEEMVRWDAKRKAHLKPSPA